MPPCHVPDTCLSVADWLQKTMPSGVLVFQLFAFAHISNLMLCSSQSVQAHVWGIKMIEICVLVTLASVFTGCNVTSLSKQPIFVYFGRLSPSLHLFVSTVSSSPRSGLIKTFCGIPFYPIFSQFAFHRSQKHAWSVCNLEDPFPVQLESSEAL